MLVLKNRQIPRGLIALDRLFDHDDIPLKSTLRPQPEEVEECNIGTVENPKLVKISKFGTRQEEKWQNKALCIFQKLKSIIPQRQLPTTNKWIIF
jgi:hypothetical protein